MSRLHFLVPCDPRRRSWRSGSQTAAAGERADIKQNFKDDDDDNCGDDDGDNDIYIMMKCMCVTKNHHFHYIFF